MENEKINGKPAQQLVSLQIPRLSFAHLLITLQLLKDQTVMKSKASPAVVAASSVYRANMSAHPSASFSFLHSETRRGEFLSRLMSPMLQQVPTDASAASEAGCVENREPFGLRHVERCHKMMLGSGSPFLFPNFLSPLFNSLLPVLQLSVVLLHKCVILSA